ncbi:ROK family protein [Nonomuraea sp. NPDC004702]
MILLNIYALDIGGSSIKHGLIKVAEHRARVMRRGVPVQCSSRKFADLRAAVLTIVAEQTSDRVPPQQHLAICTTGSVDEKGIVLNAGHFEGYVNIDWSSDLRQIFPHLSSIHVMNDGRSSTWAEFCSQTESRSLVHVVVGTGVGAGLVTEGRLMAGEHGFAGFLGHLQVHASTQKECSCGMYGCVETVAAAPAILRHFTSLGGRADIRDLRDLVDEAQAGDKFALTALASAGSWLGTAISHAINLLNPGLVTIGGGLVDITQGLGKSGLGPYVEAAIATARAKSHRRIGSRTVVRPGHHGNDGGLLGVALLAALRISHVTPR